MTSAASSCPEQIPGRRDSRNLLLVAPSPRLLREAVAAGFAVWAVADSRTPDQQGLREAAGREVELLRADFGDWPELRRLVTDTADRHRISRLLAFGEASDLPVLLETAEHLRLSPNRADSARLLSDPLGMRRLLNGNGHSHVTFAHARTAGELSAAVQQVGTRATIRQLHETAGGVRVAAGESTPAPMWRHGTAGPYLVEEPLDGPRFGVETLTVDGMHRVLGITALHHAGPAASDHLFPAVLGEREEAETRAAATGLLDLAGYEFGFGYTVVVLTADGPRIVRSQARHAEGAAGRLIELATDVPRETELFRALSGSPVGAPEPRRWATAAPLRLRAGRLTSVSGLAEIAALPGVHEVSFPYAAGDRVPCGGGKGEADWQGYVLLTAGSAEDAARRAATARRLFRAEVSKAAG